MKPAGVGCIQHNCQLTHCKYVHMATTLNAELRFLIDSCLTLQASALQVLHGGGDFWRASLYSSKASIHVTLTVVEAVLCLLLCLAVSAGQVLTPSAFLLTPAMHNRRLYFIVETAFTVPRASSMFVYRIA